MAVRGITGSGDNFWGLQDFAIVCAAGSTSFPITVQYVARLHFCVILVLPVVLVYNYILILMSGKGH